MAKPRPARPTVKCVDTYCELYKDLFVEVRAYEAFKYLHVGVKFYCLRYLVDCWDDFYYSSA